ncbi:hypothetical protein CsSME_00014798 [Camellia sinensis var. sinensis]
MENLSWRICWELIKREGYIAIWRKPLGNNCYVNRHPQLQPPICEANDDPDNAYITPLPENGYGAKVSIWPTRLHYPPDRLLTIKMDAYNSRKEIFRAESKYWNDLVNGYVNAFNWKDLHLRNVMDMKAGYGGCEPFDTYPRTYDLLNAAGLFSLEEKRPGGHVYIRDTAIVIEELKDIATAMGWETLLFDTIEGPHATCKLLFGAKPV